MKRLKLLSEFFIAIADDHRISIAHIGLYAALLQYWQEHNYENPVRLYSHEIMRIAKISASTTFYKNIKELNDFGYLKYKPSYNRYKRSRITLRL